MIEIIGAVVHVNQNYQLMKEAGITWLRHGFSWPWEADGKTLRPQYLQAKARAKELTDMGFKLFGVVGSIGSSRYDPKTKLTTWFDGNPPEAGTWDQDCFYENTARAAAFVVEDNKDLITYWQIHNEPDIGQFRGTMTYEQVRRFLGTIARTIHATNPAAKAGTNLGGISEYSLRLARDLCKNDAVFDYIGIDGYLGSWSEGGPQEWKDRIDILYDVAQKPIVINEWGYSTLESGPNPDPEHKRPYNQDVCRDKVWKNHWPGHLHTPEDQAQFITECMEVFSKHPAILGEFFFRWSDVETCWQCGDPLCPAECAWGIVDVNGNPKPGYYALKAAYEKYLKH